MFDGSSLNQSKVEPMGRLSMLSSVREVNEPESGSKTMLQFLPPDSKDSATLLNRSVFRMNRKPKL